MDSKIVSISPKRQITIPQKFFTKLGFNTQAECIIRENELVIRPAKVHDGDFDEQILSDLIAQGFSGNELLKQFKIQRKKIRPAVEKILKNAETAASGKGDYSSYEDIFNSEDK